VPRISISARAEPSNVAAVDDLRTIELVDPLTVNANSR
jgi:hypothetical protein